MRSIRWGASSISDPRLDSAFLRACRGERTDYTPIWLNRQAGRYMPEYQKLKGNTPSLEFFKHPEMAAQAALDAQRILGVDAAILFADLLPILEPLGFELEYLPGKGPRIGNPFAGDAACLRPAGEAIESLQYIGETVRNILSGLPPEVPLIGFAGAPFTLASYAIEGETSRSFLRTKRLMYCQEEAWDGFLSLLTELITDYVRIQIQAGVQAIQIFDSWIGCLSVLDHQRFVAPYTSSLMRRIVGQVPIIYFGTGNSHLLADMYATGPDVMALDWRLPLDHAWRTLGCKAIQGNLDPAVLLSDPDTIQRETDCLLATVNGKPGHIFNLGHGILPQTPTDNVKMLVDHVQQQSCRREARDLPE